MPITTMNPRTINYIVRKEKGGKYYVTYRDNPFPIAGSHGDNKHAIRFASRLEGMSAKEYMRLRKETVNRNET